MHRETTEAIRAARRSGETVEEKLARLTERAATGHATTVPAAPPLQSSLPTDPTDLVTLTLDELHDLVYLSASSINQTSTTMSKGHAQDLAKRTAITARARAAAHDGHHRGDDPRG